MPKTHFLVLLLLTVISCSPLFRPGLYTSPDGENHLVRLAWFSRYLSQGHIYPRWIDELNHGRGYPVFTFVYPLPYYFASVPVLLGLSIVDALKITLFTATFASSVLFYLWLSHLFPSRFYPLASSLVFLFTPYRFVNLYVRLALGEVVWLALVPAVFWALESSRPRLTAVLLAAAALSHLQLTAVFLPLIVVYALLRRLPWARSLLAGLVLSAFFWLPALWLKQFTYFDTLRQFPPADHLPTLSQLVYSPWGFGFSRPPGQTDDMSFQLGLANWAVLLLATFFWRRQPAVPRFCIVVCWLTVLVMSSSPLGLWNLPLLAPLQFPWRLLVVPLLFTPVLLIVIRPRLLVAVFLAFAVYANRNHLRANLPQFVKTPNSVFLQTATTTTATPKEFMPTIDNARTRWLFTASPVIGVSTAVSLLAAGTIILWPRSRFV